MMYNEQFPLIKKVFENSKKAPFYKNKYKGLIVNRFEDFQQLPVLTRQELYENSYPKTLNMLTIPEKNFIVTSTGGSTGIARYTVLTYEEWDKFVDMQAFAFKKLGVKDSDIIANIFVAGSLWPSFIASHDVIKKIGAIHLPISANIDIEKIYHYCLEFQPTVIISLPTLFVFLADKVNEKGKKFTRLHTILYAGEHMSKEVRDYISKTLKVNNIKALAYTSADAGLMGYQCEYCKPNEYHLPVKFQCIEIWDFEKNKPCEYNEEGEILVTNLARLSMPIIRYKIGDVAYWKKGACKCNDPNPLYTLCGRAGDDFKLGGAYISMNIFDKAIGKFAGKNSISMNYCFEIEDIGNKIALSLKIESGNPEKSKKYLDLIKKEIIENIPEIKTGLSIDYIKFFNIEFVKLGTLERNKITGKIKKLIDERVKE